MSRTKPAVQEKQNGRFAFRGYVPCDFVATDKASFKEWASGRSEDDLLSDLGVLVEDGYKFACGPTNRGISASLANVEGPEKYRGYMLSAFAGDAVTALHAVVYKHLVLLKRDWGEVTASEDDLLR